MEPLCLETAHANDYEIATAAHRFWTAFDTLVDTLRKHTPLPFEESPPVTDVINVLQTRAPEVWSIRHPEGSPPTPFARKRTNAYRLRREEIRLRLHAAAYLDSKGLILDEDYTLYNAVGMANVYAFNDAIRLQREGHAYVDFRGKTCTCPGWDRISQTCKCGQHQVTWDYQGDFQGIRLIAEGF